jgi:thiosulfate/3-mercaptopyruvate sulfurtransferase
MHVTIALRLRSAALVLAFPFVAASQGTAPVLVSADWLARNLKDPKLVVIHAAQQRSDYDAGHVPGARWLAWQAYTSAPPGGLSTELPPLAQLDSALETAGVSDDSRIVIVGYPIQTTGRLFFTLEYAGLSGRVSLLDGGIDAWREGGRPVERTEAKATARGQLTLKAEPSRLADAAWVNANGQSAGVSLLDARLPEFYLGESSGGQPRAGHIPGAQNVPFAWLTGEVSLYRDRARLQRLFDQAGVKKGNRVVTYCHLGQQASALYVAARILGYDAALYDGSFEEWSRKSELPVVGPVRP